MFKINIQIVTKEVILSMEHRWLKLFGMVIILLAVIMGYRYEQKTTMLNKDENQTAAVSSLRHRSTVKNQSLRSYRHARFYIKSMNSKTQKVIKPTNIWKIPNHSSRDLMGNTAELLKTPRKFTNLVQINQQATAKGLPTYDHIIRQGRSLGWIDARALHSTGTYMLPYVYISQFWPSAAKDACEEASLKTALSTQGKALNVPLRQMVQQTPLSKDPNVGYTEDPYVYGSHATIYPDAMVKIAKKYGAYAKDISGANKARFIYEITHGHAVVFEGPYMLKKPRSDHDLVILGYRKGQFFVADPFARHHYSPKTRWASTNLLMKLYNKRFRHQRALVVG